MEAAPLHEKSRDDQELRQMTDTQTSWLTLGMQQTTDPIEGDMVKQMYISGIHTCYSNRHEELSKPTSKTQHWNNS